MLVQHQEFVDITMQRPICRSRQRMFDDFAQGRSLRRLPDTRFMRNVRKPACIRKGIQQLCGMIGAIVGRHQNVESQHPVPTDPFNDEGPLVAHTCRN